MKTERIIAIDNILSEMEKDFHSKGVTQEEIDKYVTYSVLGMLGLFSRQGVDVEEGIERITNMLQGNKKGGSNHGKRS